MKLLGELKNKVEKAENQEEAKKIIEKAGMELTDDELDQVAGSGFWDWLFGDKHGPKWKL